jgi:hypothetical protein
MNELEQQFTVKYDEYERLIRIADPIHQSRIRALNTQLSELLNEMLGVLAQSRDQSGRLKAYQDELLAKLARIQQDSAALMRDKDTLETLRRIRSFEEGRINTRLYMYLAVFFACCLLVLLFMYVKGKSGSSIIPTPTMSPAPQSMF